MKPDSAPQDPVNTPIPLPPDKVRISPTGLEVSGELTFDEWRALAGHIGRAARSIGFVIGDWLVYGQGLFGADGAAGARVDAAAYQLAVEATGLDLSTLQNYAYVSRSIPVSVRSERLSWEHHRLIAKLPHDQQQRWIGLCHDEDDAGRRMSTRRLRKSLNLGRVANDSDLQTQDCDRAIDSHVPFVNRLVVWWKRMQGDGFLDHATPEQRQAIKDDLSPVVNIYNRL